LVKQGADVLGLTPVLELGLDLGEGANALAALPLLRTVLGLAAALPVHPALLSEHGDAGLSDSAALGDDVSADAIEDPADDTEVLDVIGRTPTDGVGAPDGFGNPAAGSGVDVEGGAAGHS
jgi:hypothetical protein